MHWLISSDQYHYENVNLLIKEYSLNKLLVFPQKDEIIEAIKAKDKIGILSPVEPNKKVFGNIFIEYKLKNKYGVLTKQEKESGISHADILRQRFGLDVISPENLLTLEDMAGYLGYLNWVERLDYSMSKNELPKPTIFVGMAGTGKSRGAEALAGHWSVPMIDFHFPTILESEKPFELINDIFGYLQETGMKCVIRMDEIEQTLESKGLIGKLLTLINALNTKSGFKLNGTIIATANNISAIINSVSQFFRHGRWNEKFFVSFPTEQQAIDIMKYYANKYNLEISSTLNEELDNNIYKHILISIDKVYPDVNIGENDGTITYSPAELDYLLKRLSNKKLSSLKDIEDEIEVVVPLQKTASTGTLEMYGEAKKLAFRNLN